MALTSDDLRRIGDLMDQKLNGQLDKKLDAKLKPIQDSINKVDSELSSLAVDIHAIRETQDALVNQVHRMDQGA
ncbi:MAG: hypothetical protein DHS20C17_02160 [Cyclobacteriaceae bacterium]|nr:MAG: hypothetical protein DHS20C17_02160 [Cyclobacteriaceae bacterium]